MKRALYYKKIGELTQTEFEQLFNVTTDITEPSFQERIKPIADKSIVDIDIADYDISTMDFVTAYLLGSIMSLQTKIPQNHLIVLFGEPGCGKSYLINLISELKNRDLTQITEADREFLGIAPNDYTADAEIRELKDMVDSISIIQKKTTRPSRDGKSDKPEIQEGIAREEVEKCDWTYEFANNLYGISKEEIDEVLRTNNAIMIVNDSTMRVMNGLKETYPENFLPVIVYQDFNRQKWIKDMKRAGRTEKEIEERMSTFGISQKIYDQSRLPGVIFNMASGRTAKNLLRQLNGVIQMEEGHTRELGD